jgi:hypothetical protein
MKYAAFLGVRFEPEWFALDPAERDEIESLSIPPVMGRFAGDVEVRPYRSAAFAADTNSFFLVFFADPEVYTSFVEALLETPVITRRLVTITATSVGVEQAQPAEPAGAVAVSGISA